MDAAAAQYADTFRYTSAVYASTHSVAPSRQYAHMHAVLITAQRGRRARVVDRVEAEHHHALAALVVEVADDASLLKTKVADAGAGR
jgi:hypothetical protein